MDRILNHEEVQELLGVYAVHAVDDADGTAISAHIAGCPECAEELERLLDAAAAFGMTELEEPSGEIWGRIQTEIRTENAPATATAMATNLTTTMATTTGPVASLDAARQRRQERTSRWKVAAVSAAAAIAVAVPATLAFSASPTPSLAAVASQTASQPGARIVALKDAQGKQVADAILTTGGQGYLRVSALPKLADDKTYQLWFVDNGKAVSLGLLGNTPTVTAFPSRVDVDAIAISVEPRQGSTAPSQTPLAVGALA
jgi:anti-sigma-K factor RskA